VEGYGQQFDLNREAEIEACITWLSKLPQEEGELGLVLLMRQAAKDKELYRRLIERLTDGKHSGFDLERSAWSDLGFAQQAIKDGRYRLALHFALSAYRQGDRSELLYDLLLQSLAQVKLKRHELLDLERLVDEGFINLLDEKVLRLLGTSRGFYHVYATLDPAQLNRDTLFRLAEAARILPDEEAPLFWEVILERLLERAQPLELDEEWLNRLAKRSAADPFLVACLRLRLAAEQGEEPNGARAMTDRVLLSLSREERVKALLFLSTYHSDRLHMQEALVYAQEAYTLAPRNIRVLRRLIGLNHRLGNVTERLRYLESFKALSGTLLGREYDMALDEVQLLKTKWQWSTSLSPLPADDRSDCIMHVLNKSLPAVNGYTIRSTEIVSHQKARGLHPVVVTKLGWPPVSESKEQEREAVIDGVNHYRLYAGKGQELNKVPMSEYFQAYADELAQLVLRIKPRVIHAASNFQNALPALQVARQLGIPSVYEVRGMWQDTQSSKTPGFYLSERYLLHQDYEVYCCQLADRVVAISESLRQHLIGLGVEASKIEVVPNGVDVDRFVPRPKDAELMERYNLAGKLVTGFIGSVTEYEGLDILLRALKLVQERKTDVRCLIVGDGPALQDLKRLTKELELVAQVEFVGRVPHAEVARYYSVIDVFPFPRTRAKVCELVTPLKPYEAMAMGKLVMVSDIPALREMVIDGQTGLIFEAENEQALAEALLAAPARLDLGRQSRLWVEDHRAWQDLVQAYPRIYEEAERALQGESLSSMN
jgi:PEP-CTERM/exosortase A-associated glycosyltransferase